MPFCPSCGKSIEKLSDQYCRECGTRLAQPPSPSNVSSATSLQGTKSSPLSQRSKLSLQIKLVLGIVVVAVVIIAVVASAYHPGSSNPTSPTGVSNLPTKFTHWTDPQEGSFSVLLPDGWTAKGGIQRPDAVDWGFWLDATDSGGSMSVFFALPVYPRFLVPQQAASVFCPTAQGSLCNLNQVENIPGTALPTYYVYSYMTGPDFARTLLWSSLTSLGFVKADASNPQVTASSDTAQRFAFAIGGGSYSGAAASIVYSSGGSSYKVEADVGLNNLCVLSACFWSAALSGASARQQDFNTVADIYQLVIMPTFRINPQWFLSQIQNGGTQSSMISQFSSQMRQLNYNAFKTQESTIQAGQGWVNALGGVMNMKDPSGTEYTVPSTIPDANHWWVSGAGSTIVWTRDSNGPSGYQQLTPANPSAT